MAAAKLFLDRLEELGMLDDKVIAQLRKQVAESKGPVAAETIAKLLVDKGMLTVFQAKKLIGEIRGPAEEAKAAVVKPSPSKPKSDDLELALADDEGLTPIETPPPAATKPNSVKPTSAKPVTNKPVAPQSTASKSAPTKPPTKKAEPEELAPLGDELEIIEDDGLTPLDDGLTPLEDDGLTPIDDGLTPVEDGLTTVEDDGLTPVDEALTPLDPVAASDPLAGPLDDPLLGGATSLESSSALLGAKKPSGGGGGGLFGLFGSGPKQKNKNQWDSSLIYIGGGALAILILAFVGLYLTLARGSASEAFQLAEKDYTAQAYTQAISKYEKYLAAYSSDENASLARVRVGVAQIRLAVDEGKDWKYALALTRETLKRIEVEEKFDEARSDMADILPKIAAALADKAKKSTADVDQAREFVKQADEAIELVNNGSYIPPSLRQPVEAKLALILEDVAVVKRDIGRDEELKTALDKMTTATTAGKTAEAFEVRRTLLKKYPGLNVNEQLVAATLAATAKDRELVKASDLKPTPTTEASIAMASEIVLSDRTGNPVADAAGQFTSFAMNGAVYGMDAQSGNLVWRAYTSSLMQPVPVSNQPTSDLLIAASKPDELRRVKASTGELVWRLPIDEPFYSPTIIGDKIALTTHSGKILLITAASGEVTTSVALSQSATQNTAHDGKRPHLYQLGEHSNLYVLAADTLECKEAYFVGHQAGSVAVPPVMVAGQLFIAENTGVDFSHITLLSTDADGLSIEKKQDAIRLKGTVVTTPVVDGRRVYVFTNLGTIHVFDVDPANTSEPVTTIAKVPPSRKEPLATYAAVVNGKAWLVSERLTQYELQPSKGDMARRWSHFEGDDFIAAPQRIGSALIHARQRHGAGDWIIAAADANTGNPLWQTSLSVPVLTIASAGDAAYAFNANGGQFALASPGIVGAPTTRVPTLGTPPRFTHAITLPSDKLALVASSGPAQWGGFGLGASDKAVLGKLPDAAATVSAPPAEYAGGILLPLASGQVALVDPFTSKPLLLPFQPKLEPGRSFAWHRPLAIGAASPFFAIADDRQQLYLVGRKDQPQPHLELVKQTAIDGDIQGTLAPLADGIVTVIDRAGQTTLQLLELPDLKPGAALTLAGDVHFGPVPLADGLLLGVDNAGLVSVDAELKERWKLPLEGATIVGTALVRGDNLLAVTSQGDVLRVSATDGKLQKRINIQRPLAGTPIVQGTSLYIPGIDGVVYSLPLSSLAGGAE